MTKGNSTRNAWISAAFGGLLLVVLITIFFMRPELSNDQRGLARFFIAGRFAHSFLQGHWAYRGDTKVLPFEQARVLPCFLHCTL